MVSNLFFTLSMLWWIILSPFLFASLKENKAPPKPVVSVETVKAGLISDRLTYPARTVPKINAPVLSETAGVVKNISTPLGSRVKKHQTIMVIANTDPIYNYAPFLVSASVSGVISKILVTEGSNITKGQQIAQITDPSKIFLEVEIAVSDLQDIKTGLLGEFEFGSGENRLPVKVIGVSPYVDPATGTATAELDFVQNPKDVSPAPGLLGKVHFKVKEHDGFQIPEYAVFFRSKDPFIRIVKDNKVSFNPVTLGKTRKGSVEILKGLEENMVVVTRANKYAPDGEEVEVQN